MAVALHPRWSRYESANEIDAGEPGDDDAALSSGLSASCPGLGRDGFDGLFVDKKHLVRINGQVMFSPVGDLIYLTASRPVRFNNWWFDICRMLNRYE